MTIKLRPYQEDCKQKVYNAWAEGQRNALLVLPTGAGKTALATTILRENRGASCMIAHRQELVLQISQSVACNEVRHSLSAPLSVVKLAVAQHMAETRRSWYEPSAPCLVAGVDTLIRRQDALRAWANSVTLVIMDEAHHVLRDNKWGKAVAMFPNARFLGVTATPCRSDGAGLGVHADGIFESMVTGPSMRDLIGMKFLTDYRVFAPPSDLDLTQVHISVTTGDYNQTELRKTIHRSHLHGDVVQHYLRIAPGKLGVTFAVDVESATRIAADFNAAGVPAAVVSAKTPDRERVDLLRQFRERKLLQLVNVDLFGEGFDLPAIEVVSMARPTESYGLFVQMFGRALRILPSDPAKVAIIIDHVGNVLRHGLPDAPRQWTLDRRERKQSATPEDVIPLKACPECTQVYERFYPCCPYCGYKPVIAARSDIHKVDGDLLELDGATLAAMRGEVDRIDLPDSEFQLDILRRHVPAVGQRAELRRHQQDREAQRVLRDSIALWGGYQRASGMTDGAIFRKFYLTYGLDILSAQALRFTEATVLRERIEHALNLT